MGDAENGLREFDERPLPPRRSGTECRDASVPFFFKQWGGFNKKRNGRELDGRMYDEMPEKAQLPMPSLLRRRQMVAEFHRDLQNMH